jgi:hypothetical protein
MWYIVEHEKRMRPPKSRLPERVRSLQRLRQNRCEDDQGEESQKMMGWFVAFLIISFILAAVTNI